VTGAVVTGMGSCGFFSANRTVDEATARMTREDKDVFMVGKARPGEAGLV
jgi:hypothetical protein